MAKRISFKGVGTMMVVLLLIATGEPARAAAGRAAEFYRGKIIEAIVPYKTGGGYDAWVRALAPFFNKYSGATLVIKNVPGAGSLIGTNRLYAADPNGLTIGILNVPGALQSQLNGLTGVKYDLLHFTWLGRLTSEQRVICAGAKSPYKTIEAMRRATEPIKFGASGIGSPTFLDLALIGEALGIKSDIITGYETMNEVDIAVMRGEIEAALGSYSSKRDVINNGDMVAVAQYGNTDMPELKKVPNVAKLPGVSTEGRELIRLVVTLLEVGRALAGPPGMSPAKAKFLEGALQKSLADPGFVAIAERRGMEIMYLPAAAEKKTIREGLAISPDLKRRVLEIMDRYRPAR